MQIIEMSIYVTKINVIRNADIMNIVNKVAFKICITKGNMNVMRDMNAKSVVYLKHVQASVKKKFIINTESMIVKESAHLNAKFVRN